ncbi:MAG: response regulator [Candidatus Omnitrophica bacterium]|nr:response regulator [Candidatus Omnitrophota bacterium]
MRKKVMIVEDDKEFIDELTNSLLMDGYEVIPVSNSKEALRTAIRTKPDVVLLDIVMSGKSGFQVASDIVYFSGLDDTSIIIMTGRFEERYDTLIRLCGFKGLLRKPFSYPDLLCKIGSANN